jgi:hypothetical protein
LVDLVKPKTTLGFSRITAIYQKDRFKAIFWTVFKHKRAKNRFFFYFFSFNPRLSEWSFTQINPKKTF